MSRPGARPAAGARPGAAARLTARGLVRRYGGIEAVASVDLTAPPGRITALIGPNGAGKSTLFDCLAGTVRPDAGRVLLGGREVTRLPAHARVRIGLARTFQQIAVFPTLSVADNVRVGAEQRPGARRDARAVDAAAGRALALVGLQELAAQPAGEQPTGVLRLVELARALAGDPRVLLLDEPAAGLDTAQTARLVAVLRGLADRGMALLLVEHDPDLVAELADAVYAMADGRVVAHGPAGAVLTDARVARAWGRDRRGGDPHP
ncbi:ABC transporter ATP-binding protein [Kitasatospora sp. A2-31]|uniref:ABC transporter ATP-binding protein n=1 Tax=Kitasatospora sp. A2-31 TaxID=2916414 RepID=UPI001EEA58F5|nr:ABC transporter ATP-binding protein [Kitasatospora sp. A2-31]MCG6495832.1 ABC transporter ATP-binding protein [Kitasatospora sp. A2-31]